jgi:hypothetical protein
VIRDRLELLCQHRRRGVAAIGLNMVFGTVVTWSDVPAGRGIVWGCLTILLLSAAKAGQARKARVPTRLR